MSKGKILITVMSILLLIFILVFSCNKQISKKSRIDFSKKNTFTECRIYRDSLASLRNNHDENLPLLNTYYWERVTYLLDRGFRQIAGSNGDECEKNHQIKDLENAFNADKYYGEPSEKSKKELANVQKAIQDFLGQMSFICDFKQNARNWLEQEFHAAKEKFFSAVDECRYPPRILDIEPLDEMKMVNNEIKQHFTLYYKQNFLRGDGKVYTLCGKATWQVLKKKNSNYEVWTDRMTDSYGWCYP